jgi:hypothetical protein
MYVAIDESYTTQYFNSLMMLVSYLSIVFSPAVGGFLAYCTVHVLCIVAFGVGGIQVAIALTDEIHKALT